VAELDLSGKTAIITGASSGIGQATARALAAVGVKVAGGARRVDRLETEVALELDVTDPESCARFVEEAVARLGGTVNILFNNAGLALGRAPFDESSEEDEAQVFATNVNGLVRMTRLCLPYFGDWGHIVNMGSVAGRQAYPGGATYIAAKFAERGFTYALREDLLGRPIRITTVDAGMVLTEFSLVRFKGDAEKAASVYEGIDAMTAEDISDCVMFALQRPWHMNVDEIVVKARNQASGGRILRDGDA
jgi:3-hydroxy acid dehydrogenase/malonic semialdehyde reductase